LPSVDRLDRATGKEDLEILLVDIRETQEQVSAFIDSNNYASSVLLDSNGQVSNAYSIFTIPAAVLIDRKGAIAFRASGGTDWDSGQMRSIVNRLLEE